MYRIMGGMGLSTSWRNPLHPEKRFRPYTLRDRSPRRLVALSRQTGVDRCPLARNDRIRRTRRLLGLARPTDYGLAATRRLCGAERARSALRSAKPPRRG